MKFLLSSFDRIDEFISGPDGTLQRLKLVGEVLAVSGVISCVGAILAPEVLAPLALGGLILWMGALVGLLLLVAVYACLSSLVDLVVGR